MTTITETLRSIRNKLKWLKDYRKLTNDENVAPLIFHLERVEREITYYENRTRLRQDV